MRAAALRVDDDCAKSGVRRLPAVRSLHARDDAAPQGGAVLRSSRSNERQISVAPDASQIEVSADLNLALIRAGMSHLDFAREQGVSESMVRQWCSPDSPQNIAEWRIRKIPAVRKAMRAIEEEREGKRENALLRAIVEAAKALSGGDEEMDKAEAALSLARKRGR